MSDSQVAGFFLENQGRICGRFSPGQLKEYKSTLGKVRPGYTLFKAAVITALMLVLNKNTYGQSKPNKPGVEVTDESKRHDHKTSADETERWISGTVIDESDGSALPGINVV